MSVPDKILSTDSQVQGSMEKDLPDIKALPSERETSVSSAASAAISPEARSTQEVKSHDFKHLKSADSDMYALMDSIPGMRTPSSKEEMAVAKHEVNEYLRGHASAPSASLSSRSFADQEPTPFFPGSKMSEKKENHDTKIEEENQEIEPSTQDAIMPDNDTNKFRK